VTSDARVRPPDEDGALPGAAPDAVPGNVAEPEAESGGPADRSEDRSEGRSRGRGIGRRLARAVVPMLATVLVLLLGGIAFVWWTWPEKSSVRTDAYASALEAARSGVVDMTSFDHVTLDDDIEQIRRVATGDLQKEAVAQLEDNRAQLIDSEAVVNTEVVGAGVTRADKTRATVLMVIQSTRQTAGSQAQVVRYRIEVELKKTDSRWLLSGIKGTGTNG
jgi:Mce-associated membrane protein